MGLIFKDWQGNELTELYLNIFTYANTNHVGMMPLIVEDQFGGLVKVISREDPDLVEVVAEAEPPGPNPYCFPSGTVWQIRCQPNFRSAGVYSTIIEIAECDSVNYTQITINVCVQPESQAKQPFYDTWRSARATGPEGIDATGTGDLRVIGNDMPINILIMNYTDWVAVSPSEFNTSGTHAFGVNCIWQGRSPGVYIAPLHIYDRDSYGNFFYLYTCTLEYTVEEGSLLLSYSPGSVERFIGGGDNADDFTLRLENIGTGIIDYELDVSYDDDPRTWIIPDYFIGDLVGGGTPDVDQVNIRLNTNAVPIRPEPYVGRITISYERGTEEVFITLHVGQQGNPELSYLPTSVSRNIIEGETADPFTLTLQNVGTGILNYTLSPTVQWVEPAQTSGDLINGGLSDIDNIEVALNTADLAARPALPYVERLYIEAPDIPTASVVIGVAVHSAGDPVLWYSPESINETVIEGNNFNFTLSLENRGTGTLEYALSASDNWIQPASQGGDLVGGEDPVDRDDVNVPLQTHSFSTRTAPYSGTLTITLAGTGTAFDIPINITIVTEEGLEVSPTSLNIRLLRGTQGYQEIVMLTNVSWFPIEVMYSENCYWYDVDMPFTSLGNGEARSVTITITDTSTAGVFANTLQFGWRYPGQSQHSLNLPIALTVIEYGILDVNAGPDVRMLAAQLTRTGTVNPTDLPGLVTRWDNVGHSLPNLGGDTTLIVDFPEPPEEGRDYTFKFTATCPSCTPNSLSDEFTAHIVKYLLESVAITPAESTVDLDVPISHSIMFTCTVSPVSLTVSQYTWSDAAGNPHPVIPQGQEHSRETLTISSWPEAGSYQISCAVETNSGSSSASASIIVIGGAEGPEPLPEAVFPSEDDLYNVGYFIVRKDDTGFVGTLEDIPQQTTPLSSVYDIPLPSANPAICSAHNNKLMPPNEQYIYIAYQAFYLYKWHIYLRQIRLSDYSDAVRPGYEAPYKSAGAATPNEIETVATFTSGDCEAIDVETGKKYWYSLNVIYRSDLDGTNEETLYTYTGANPNITYRVQGLALDTSVSPTIIYFVHALIGIAPVTGSIVYLVRAEVDDIAGTISENIYGCNGDEVLANISNITVSQNYIYWYAEHGDNEYRQIWRRLKSLALTSSDLIEDERAQYWRFSADYENDHLYVVDYDYDKAYRLDAQTLEITELQTFDFDVSSSATMKVDSTNQKIYLEDGGNIIRFGPDDASYEIRLLNESYLDMILAIDEINSKLYWLDRDGSTYWIKRTDLYFDMSISVSYVPFDFYTVSYLDNTGETDYITRVKYHIEAYNNAYKVTRIDKYGYYHDVEFVITYRGDLSAYWYDSQSLFGFTDVVPNLTASNLTNMPFDVHTSSRIYTDNWFFGDINTSNWRLVAQGTMSFQAGQFGACGAEMADPILIGCSTNGHSMRPAICCNYNNDVIVAYEDTEYGRPQIKLIGTGDFCQNSFIGPRGSMVTELFTEEDFCFTHDVTEPLIREGSEGINQLADIIADKNNVIHLVWQSNRDQYWEIYYANSTNSFTPVRLTQSKSRSMSPSIDINDEGHIYVAFHDDRFGKYEIFVGYQEENRVLPLFQQDEYLGSLDDDYDHYIDIIRIPVKNSTTTDMRIHVVVKFFDNRILSGDPVLTVSTQHNPDLFQIENETAALYGIAEGVYVEAGQTVYLLLTASGLALNYNQTYFIKLEYIYPDETTLQVLDIYISFSCLQCTKADPVRWTGSGGGYSDTRVTDSTRDSVRPVVTAKSSGASGRLMVLWEDYRFNKSQAKILGALFDSSKEIDDLRATGANWFDYDYDIIGKDPAIIADLFDRIISCYETSKTEGSKTDLPTIELGYKVCDFQALPETGVGGTGPAAAVAPVCDYSHITTNILTEDPNMSSRYVKQLNILPDDVDYYTRNASGASIPVVSKCSLRFELLGTPEVLAYRLKNENETVYSEWYPFKPKISDYYTQFNHKISTNSGIKEICVEVATYTGITVSFSLSAIADYEPIPFDIVLTTEIENQEIVLPAYQNTFIASSKASDSIDINVYIVLSEQTNERLKGTIPSFDVLQQGTNDLHGQSTSIGTLPASVDISGIVYKSVALVTIYREDGRYNRDGLARIKPRFDTECFSQISSEATVSTRDPFSDFGKAVVLETAVDDLVSFRDSQSGRIGILPDSRDRYDEDVFDNAMSMYFKGQEAIIINNVSDMPVWRTTGYSISFWTKGHDLVGSGTTLFEETNYTDFFRIYKDGQLLSVTTPSGETWTTTSLVFDNTWHHICWVEHNGTAGIYVDGERDQVISGTPTSETATIPMYSTIGANRTGSSSYSSYLNQVWIDEFAAWNITLVPDDIKQLYNRGCPTSLIKATSLILWYRMGDDWTWNESAWTIPDASGNRNYGTPQNLIADVIVKNVPCLNQ